MTDNLSDTFGKPGKSLAGMLPPRSGKTGTTEEQPAKSEAEVADTQEQPDAGFVDVGQDPVDETATKAVTPVVHHQDGTDDELGAAELATSQVPVYVVPELITAVRQVREGRTNAEMAFEAIDALHGRLSQLVAKRRTPPTRSGSRFPARDNRRHRSGTRRVLWAIRATGRERAILESIRKEAGADSVSEVVSVAVEARYLKKSH